MSHAGTALLRELAERTGLRTEYASIVDGLRRRGGGHVPGQVLVDVAVMLADGGEAIADIAALTEIRREQSQRGLSRDPDPRPPVPAPRPPRPGAAPTANRRTAPAQSGQLAAYVRGWCRRVERVAGPVDEQALAVCSKAV